MKEFGEGGVDGRDLVCKRSEVPGQSPFKGAPWAEALRPLGHHGLSFFTASPCLTDGPARGNRSGLSDPGALVCWTVLPLGDAEGLG